MLLVFLSCSSQFPESEKVMVPRVLVRIFVRYVGGQQHGKLVRSFGACCWPGGVSLNKQNKKSTTTTTTTTYDEVHCHFKSC